MQLVAQYPRVTGSVMVPATLRWTDGLVATTPSWGNSMPLPHDIGHYITEAWFRPRYGFWQLAFEQIPFSSLTLVRGQWPKGAKRRLERLLRKHGPEMLKAEATDLSPVLSADADLDTAWPSIQRSLKRLYDFVPDNPFAEFTRADLEGFANRARAVRNIWRRVPKDGAIQVVWPPDCRPEIVDDYHPPA